MTSTRFKKVFVGFLVFLIALGSGTVLSLGAEKPKKLVFFHFEEPSNVFLYKGVDEFEKDYGIKVERISVPDKEYLTKSVAMLVAGEQIDVLFVRNEYISAWTEAGFIIPVTDMSGIIDYKEELFPSAWQAMNHKGEIWGLPYYSGIFTSWYNPEKLKEAGIGKLAETWEEVIEQARKLKSSGVSEFPILWPAGLGDMHLIWQWYNLVLTRGGTIFDEELNPTLGPNSVARKSLEWWQKTFLDEKVSDPHSTELRYYPSYKAFGSGDYLYHFFPMDYTIVMANTTEDLPLAGKIRNFLNPGNHKTVGWTRIYGIPYTTVDKNYAWKLMEYLGGKTKEGELLVPGLLMVDAVEMGYPLASAYKKVQAKPLAAKVWGKFSDWPKLRAQWKKAADITTPVSAFYEPWYKEWQDFASAQVQKTLMGSITPDEACEAIIRKIKELKR